MGIAEARLGCPLRGCRLSRRANPAPLLPHCAGFFSNPHPRGQSGIRGSLEDPPRPARPSAIAMNDNAHPPSAPILATAGIRTFYGVRDRALHVAIDAVPDPVLRIAAEAHEVLVGACDVVLTQTARIAEIVRRPHREQELGRSAGGRRRGTGPR